MYYMISDGSLHVILNVMRLNLRLEIQGRVYSIRSIPIQNLCHPINGRRREQIANAQTPCEFHVHFRQKPRGAQRMTKAKKSCDS